MHYPKHIAIIPDGNRTRAKAQGMTAGEGHYAGFNNAIELAKYIFQETPIQAFTLRCLSTQNVQKRSKEELAYLYELLRMVTNELQEFIEKNQINFQRAGTPDGLPAEIVDYLQGQQKKYTFATAKYITLCVNYGGQDEIIRGIQKRQAAGAPQEKLTTEHFGQYLDFNHVPPIDLVVRTKGDMARRLSGFMLWQVGYAELYFTPDKFPAFTPNKLQEALTRFDQQVVHRNFGK